MSPDPYYGSYDISNPQSMNRYAYVMDSPLGYLDPSGLEWVWDSGSSCFNWDYTDVYGGQEYDHVDACAEDDVIGGDPGTGPGVIPGGGGGGGGGAPSNGPSYSPEDICGASALLNKGAKTLGTTLLDAIGIIPGEGNVLKAVQLSAGLVSTGVTVADSNSSWAGFGFSGGGLGLTVVSGSGLKFKAKLLGESFSVVPVLGNFLSLGATANDIFGENEMSNYYDACLAGKN